MTGRQITRTSTDFAVTKALASVEIGPNDDAAGPGTFSLILSTDAVDRDGEVVEKGAFNPLPDHISMDVDHGMSVATTVGSGRPFYNSDGDLQVDGTFASTELGQSVRTLVREGHVRTASVAMIPTVKTKSKDDGPARITKADLLNGAFTPVPSNTTAKVLSAKSAADLADLKAGARHSAADLKAIQSIHDMSAGLGAICGDGSSEGKSFRGASVKSIVGSVEALQDRIRDALEDAYGQWNTCLRGVLPDTVVFDFWGTSGTAGLDPDSTYSQTYTDDGAVVTLTGTPSPVDIHEVVAPDADADREGKSAADAAATKAAADAADDPATADAYVQSTAAALLKSLHQ
jgi:hypothetical protein